MKYPIDKQFFPYTHSAPLILSAKLAGWMGSLMKPPRWIWKDKEVSVQKKLVKGYQGAEIEVLLIEPREIKGELPCLVYYHGGGFFFGAGGYHYKYAKEYALKTPCKVAMAQYRLAPKNPHPTPVEDCYAALRWAFENAEELGIDRTKIGVGGDSAGGALAAAVCQMARDRNTDLPCLQMLIYPVTDRRMQTESNRKYTDTPMWNSKLSVKMWKGYTPNADVPDIAYASPMQAIRFDGLPQAYVEVAEFDCLRDEGIAYAEALRAAGAKVELNELKGTMHGFDIAEKAEISKRAVQVRVERLKSAFYDIKI